MKVKLISSTKDPLALLLYTKNTRLQANTSMEEIEAWPMEKKLDHLSYMRDTIKSSWEFIDYVFEISEVSRAFTHQFVRTRTGSFAQESQRTIDASDNGWVTPSGMDEEHTKIYDDELAKVMSSYSVMLEAGMSVQNARGALPTNINTSIIAKFNLRTMHDMAKTRLCFRTQGEYQEVFNLMKKEIVAVHPWADDFIQVACVDSGICQFPRYTECPIQKFCVPVESLKVIKRELRKAFDTTHHEATPIAKAGRTM